MTKQEILDYFSLIDFAYNESGRFESLSRMLDELLKEQEKQRFFLDEDGKITPLPVVVRCKECKHFEPDGVYTICYRHNGLSPSANWFCADGERKEKSNGNQDVV